MRKRKNILTFIIGFLVVVTLPMLSSLGVPTFDIVLVSIFGKDSIFALIFSFMLIISIAFGLGKLANAESVR